MKRFFDPLPTAERLRFSTLTHCLSVQPDSAGRGAGTQRTAAGLLGPPEASRPGLATRGGYAPRRGLACRGDDNAATLLACPHFTSHYGHPAGQSTHCRLRRFRLSFWGQLDQCVWHGRRRGCINIGLFGTEPYATIHLSPQLRALCGNLFGSGNETGKRVCHY